MSDEEDINQRIIKDIETLNIDKKMKTFLREIIKIEYANTGKAQPQYKQDFTRVLLENYDELRG